MEHISAEESQGSQCYITILMTPIIQAKILVMYSPMLIALLYHRFGERGIFTSHQIGETVVKYHFFNDSDHYFSDTYDKYHQNSDKARSQIKEIESATC